MIIKVQNEHDNILVVGALSHCFDKVDVRVLSALTVRVVRVAPHDDVTDLVQDAMGLFKVSPSHLSVGGCSSESTVPGDPQPSLEGQQGLQR